MARAIWSGALSFGLLNVPVTLMIGERRTDIHFRMLDAHNSQPIRYEHVVKFCAGRVLRRGSVVCAQGIVQLAPLYDAPDSVTCLFLTTTVKHSTAAAYVTVAGRGAVANGLKGSFGATR